MREVAGRESAKSAYTVKNINTARNFLFCSCFMRARGCTALALRRRDQVARPRASWIVGKQIADAADREFISARDSCVKV